MNDEDGCITSLTCVSMLPLIVHHRIFFCSSLAINNNNYYPFDTIHPMWIEYKEILRQSRDLLWIRVQISWSFMSTPIVLENDSYLSFFDTWQFSFSLSPYTLYAIVLLPLEKKYEGQSSRKQIISTILCQIYIKKCIKMGKVSFLWMCLLVVYECAFLLLSYTSSFIKSSILKTAIFCLYFRKDHYIVRIYIYMWLAKVVHELITLSL